LKIKKIIETKSLNDVLISVIDDENENDDVFAWKTWIEMKIVIELDFKICFFDERLNDSKINRFDDVSIKISTSCECFFLIQIIDETW
jgi:hypothetical protein